MNENLYALNSIRTMTGIYVDFVNPTKDMFVIEDIAHSLSKQVRFAGHLYESYTVAQHCINCCYMAGTKQDKFEALMHDSSEAYLLDIPSPIKPLLNGYKEIEDKLMILIAEQFGFKYPLSQTTKDIDKMMLHWEWDYYMLKKPLPNNERMPNILNSLEAKNKFIELYNLYKPNQNERK